MVMLEDKIKSSILFFMILAWFSRFKNAVFLLFKVNTFSYEIACSIDIHIVTFSLF